MEEIQELQNDINNLRSILFEKEEKLKCLLKKKEAGSINSRATGTPSTILLNHEIARYSRQLLLPNVAVSGQLKLKNTSFLVVGVGGLGSPAAQYLAAAGCGSIGLVDYDLAEISNLNRQVLLKEEFCNLPKVYAAEASLMQLNSKIHIETYHTKLNRTTAMDIIGKFDIIVDCTDDVGTRYLLNDVCVLKKKPLISGSALQFDGQLTVYNYMDGPCYRCIFAIPPPADTIMNCSDAGVIGAVTGVIGSLQALEAVKVALELKDTLAGRLLLFDGLRSTFRCIKLRGKRKSCEVCSDCPTITEPIDYEQFCRNTLSKDNFRPLSKENRISALEYKQFLTSKHILIDVRNSIEFEICKLDNAINIPLKKLLENSEELKTVLKGDNIPVIFYCRRGNDSQLAVHHFIKCKPKMLAVKDIIGGLYAWNHYVDDQFPLY